MNFTNPNPKQMVDSDFDSLAKKMNVKVEAIKAMAEIESAGEGYFSDGRPKILFESRIFNMLTNGAFINNPLAEKHKLATWNWRRNYYRGASEYIRLEAALQLNENAALRACSWGAFQILGDNSEVVGYNKVVDYVKDVVDGGEPMHLEHFGRFILANGIDKPLRKLAWHQVARRYNGPGYRQNNYARRMEAAYLRFKDGQPLTQPHKGIADVTEIQSALLTHGYPIIVDGIIGPQTIQVIKQFQAARGLIADGIVGPKTWAALTLKEKVNETT